MSILQRILQNMYVEPELLDELDEEQKQILFCKIREEQLRRWNEYEKSLNDGTYKPEPNTSKRRAKVKCNVKFRLDKSGQPWTWVMGEHPDDPSIDEIIEQETHEKAHELAEREVDQVRRKHEEALKASLATDGDLLESVVENGILAGRPTNLAGKQASLDEDNGEAEELMRRIMDIPSPRASLSPTPSTSSLVEYDEDAQLNDQLRSSLGIESSPPPPPPPAAPAQATPDGTPPPVPPPPANHSLTPSPPPVHTVTKLTNGINGANDDAELAASQRHEKELAKQLESLNNLALNYSAAHHRKPTTAVNGGQSRETTPPKSVSQSAFTVTEMTLSNANSNGRETSPAKEQSPPPAVREKEKERTPPPVAPKPLRLRASATFQAPSGSPSPNSVPRAIATVEELERKLVEQSAREIEMERQKRELEIYESLKEARLKANREAEQEQSIRQQQFEEQERRAREADEHIRAAARRAREEHKQHEMTSAELLEMLERRGHNPTTPRDSPDRSTGNNNNNNVDESNSFNHNNNNTNKNNNSYYNSNSQQYGKSQQPANNISNNSSNLVNGSLNRIRGPNLTNGIRSGAETPITFVNGHSHHQPQSNGLSRLSPVTKVPRPPKPKSRDAILKWFMRDEYPRGTGIDPRTGAVATWFHGLISREASDDLLAGRARGAYLVRVSERIWGYTLSYALADGQTKHFLIERTSDGYQFLGTNQYSHANLWDLISYHQTVPITPQGREVLLEPVGQNTHPPDYQGLFPANLR